MDDPAEPGTDRPTPVRAAAVIVVAFVLAAVTFSWVQEHTPAPHGPGTGLTGTLIYAVDVGDGQADLWRWDLASNVVQRGPRVQDPVELVDADGAQPGWVGVTSRNPAGRLSASILRSLAPADRATTLAKGDVVTWGERGNAITAMRTVPMHGCRTHVTILLQKLIPLSIREHEVDRSVCGDVTSVGRGIGTTFFTLRRGDRIGVMYAGYKQFHPVLDDYTMISVSQVNDLLVTTDAAGGGASLYFSDLPRPILYVDHAEALRIDRVLAWSNDSLRALVTGVEAGRTGLFMLDTGPGDGRRSPTFVAPVTGRLEATFADDGTAFVLTDRGLHLLAAGGLEPLRAPEGAPVPDGPLVWIR